MQKQTAVIIGASSGIGEELARQLSHDGWRLGICARRIDKLNAVAAEIGEDTLVRQIDLTEPEAAIVILEEMVESLGAVDLIVISSGVGYNSRSLDWTLEKETLMVNVVGFAALAQMATRYFLERGSGHLVGITSVAALRGGKDAAGYCASKSFDSFYLDGLRDLVRPHRKTITITEAQPGFVRTAMMKSKRAFWVETPERAAEQIVDAIRRKAKHAYITRRWGLVAMILKILPRPG